MVGAEWRYVRIVMQLSNHDSALSTGYRLPDTGYCVLFWECPDAWWVPRPSKPLRRRFARRLVGSIPIHSRNKPAAVGGGRWGSAAATSASSEVAIRREIHRPCPWFIYGWTLTVLAPKLFP